jgi:hypothetical protein
MSPLTRRAALTGAGAVSLAALGATVTSTATATAAPAPDAVLDTSHATAEAVELVVSTFRDKTARDVDRFMAHFSQRLLTYTDATLGAQYTTWPALKALFAQFMPAWPPTIRSYPTKIIGDSRSAMVIFADSPEMFGHELRIIAPIDFRDRKIVREADYWDGRHFGVAATQAIRTAPGQFATDFGEGAVGEQSPAVLRTVAAALATAFAAGDTAAASALFTTDATFEDLTLHAAVIGRPAIQGFLDRSRALLPYGLGTSVRHVVGSAQGGGYEWRKQGAPVDHGVIALELDEQAHISRLTTIWDGSLVDNATIAALLATTIEQ